MATWHNLGDINSLKDPPLREIKIESRRIALSYVNEEFAAIDGVCAHVGGPLGQGTLKGEKGEQIVCPWHYFRYDRKSGVCRLGESLEISVPRYELKTEDGNLLINLEPASEGKPLEEYEDSLTRPIVRAPGPIRWGSASSLYYKMVERLNAIQNQITLHNNVLIRNKG